MANTAKEIAQSGNNNSLNVNIEMTNMKKTHKAMNFLRFA